MRLAALVVVVVISAVPVLGQSKQYAGYDRPPGTRDAGWVFCTLRFERVRYEAAGTGWMTDFPKAGQNFSRRVMELTGIGITMHPQRSEEPMQWVVSPTDGDALSTCPLVFTSDVGTLAWQDGEVEAMRAYLLKGGVLWVDDFWGPAAWDYWHAALMEILPGARHRIVDVPPDHPILNAPYRIRPWQMPNIGHWKTTGGKTSERGDASAEPHFRAVFDPDDDRRLMVLMTHNTDVFDAWEQEADGGFFGEFATPGYGFGVNVLLHVLTH